ncbi:MAG: DNA alkylation repair protein [Bacteroidota bacterium]
MTVKEIMTTLAAKGSDSIKKILLKHGVKEPFFGVKVEELKKIQKVVNKDYQLAKDLYATGNADAMYLAGLIADDEKMTKKDLNDWVRKAHSDNISGYTVPWVAAESNHGYALGLEWIDSKEPNIAAAGWNTLSNVIALKPDTALDLEQIKKLLARIEEEIHTAPNRIRQCMNAFIIAAGSHIASLTDKATASAKKIGTVTVDMNGTACKVPSAVEYIQKVKDKNAIGKKKKTVKC